MFADDIVLLAENKEDLQTLMDITYRYSQTWRFNFNYDKCAVVIFEDTMSGPIKYGECKVECTCGRHWKLGSRLIIETDSYKYLRVELDNRLTFKQFKARILDKARKSRTRVWNMGMKQGAFSVKASVNLEYVGRAVGRSRDDTERERDGETNPLCYISTSSYQSL